MTSEATAQRGNAARRAEAAVLRAAERGELQQAVAHCRALNQQHPHFASGWYTASQLAGRLGKRRAALQAIEKAIELEPDSPRWQLQKASCLMSMGNIAQARPLLQSLDRVELNSGFQCAQLALQLSRLGMQDRALEHYRRAIMLEPGESSHYYNAATVYRFLGDFDSAEQHLDRAIALNPQDFEAYKLRSDLRTQTRERNNLSSLRKALATHAERPAARVYLNFALGKELEDLAQWQEAFTHLAAGADERRARMRYDVAGDLDTMRAIARHFDRARLSQPVDAAADDAPIFVIGMPRTGTTLVERILASHSQVRSAGELNDFALQMSALVNAGLPEGADPRALDKPQRVELAAQIDFSELGRRYLASARGHIDASPRFVDKLPLNFLYAGLIHLALPGAKLVHLVRHPLDTCFAIYKTLFAEAYPFSYKLEDLGRYYAAYRRLMAHWDEAMPGVIYHQRYEALVTDFEAQARALLAACGLDWEPACLQFHRQANASTTASATQVRQPVYTSSVQRWRQYREQLLPLIETLEREGIDPEL